MASPYFEVCEGPIRGLRLPLNAWVVLQREGITTLDQLRAAAPRIDHLMGIGSKTALLIKQELARISLATDK